MNFFQAQDRARRNSVLLFFLFAAAVASLAILVYLAAAFVLHPKGPGADPLPEFNPDLFLKTTAGVLAIVAFGSLTKTLALAAGGGAAVAQAMGGKLVPPATRDPLERRLINVVEEMAIASGVPAPQTYLIPDPAINAFAAGTRPDNAVVGMTRGALEALSRDELQGVVAHEFSHILNGDMRLNLRLIGILHGVLLIGYIGYFILRSSLYGGMMRSRDSRGGAAAALPLIGLALVIAGFAGSFFGNWIRAAVSRQREFLADASAVQFTRNPRGIGGALEKIGILSGKLSSPRASECRHMCFADSVASGFANPFATHPPLPVRIRRIFPQWSEDEKIGVYDSETKSRIAKMSGAAAGAVAGFAAAEGAPAAAAPEEFSREEFSKGAPPDLFGMLFDGGGGGGGGCGTVWSGGGADWRVERGLAGVCGQVSSGGSGGVLGRGARPAFGAVPAVCDGAGRARRGLPPGAAAGFGRARRRGGLRGNASPGRGLGNGGGGGNGWGGWVAARGAVAAGGGRGAGVADAVAAAASDVCGEPGRADGGGRRD